MRKVIFFLLLLFLFFGTIKQVEALRYSKAVESCELKYNFTNVDSHCARGNKVVPPTASSDSGVKTIKWGVCCFLNSLYKTSDTMALLIMPVALLIFLYAAFQFMTSGGDANKLEEVKRLILYALIGVFIVVLAKTIVFVIKSIV